MALWPILKALDSEHQQNDILRNINYSANSLSIRSFASKRSNFECALSQKLIEFRLLPNSGKKSWRYGSILKALDSEHRKNGDITS